MIIAGFKKQSLIDYPGNISSVVFTQGCNFRCSYCHNPELVLPEKYSPKYNTNDIFNYLELYKNLLDAVCITGGEPTLHKNLPAFIKKIKALGLKVKLDTNGTNSVMLKQLLSNKLIDAIAMDIKHVLDSNLYNNTVGRNLSRAQFQNIQKSIEYIKQAGISYEFRTTIAKGLHDKQHIMDLKKQFGNRFKLQNFNPEIVLTQKQNMSAFSTVEFNRLTG